MIADFVEIYLLTFIAVAAGYSALASWTPFFYRKKAWGRLKASELKVKQGAATLEDRLALFMKTFFISFFTHQLYLFVLVLAGLIYLFIYLRSF